MVVSIGLGLITQASAQSPSVAQTSHVEVKALESLSQKSRALASKTEFEAEKVAARLKHAKELLGKSYQRSVVKASEGIANLDEALFQWTSRALQGKWKKYSRTVAKTILQQSEKYHFDPIFLMAVIENESSFNPGAHGSHGEIGLMQLIPDTAEWIANKYDLPWKGANSLKDPATNIKIGAAYLAYLREKFSFRSQLYLAAYNMGSTNVLRALGRQVWPKEYSSRVMQRYVRYYSELSEDAKASVN